MNICHVVDLISQNTGGGSAKVPYHLACEQVRLGHNVAIFASDYGSDGQQPPDGVELRRFHSIAYLFDSWSITPSMFFADFKQFDIIHLHNYRTLVNVIAANRHVPYVLQAHGNCAPYPPNWSKVVWDTFWRTAVFNRAKGYIADAPLEVDHYVIEGANLKQITTIPVGIDLAEYTDLPIRRQHGKKRILYLGKMYWIKGPDLLARALALIKRDDIELAVASVDFGYEATFRQLVRDLGIEHKVQYLGSKFGREKLQEFIDADVYVMPSAYEMWGITLLEALACGTPVVITDRCEIAKVLPSHCGEVVPFDAQCLADAIVRAVDGRVAERDREKRLTWVGQYGWEKIAPKVVKFYEKVLDNESH